MIKGISDVMFDLSGDAKDGFGDGFRALWMLNKRFDSKTYSSILQAYLDVVKPPVIKKAIEVTAGIHRWEAEVTALENRYGKDLEHHLKLAILIGIIPMDYQGMILQTGMTTEQLEYDVCRDRIYRLRSRRSR